MQWYYSKSGTQLGPVEEVELRAKLASGEVSAVDLVWREGMTDWLPAARVVELSLQSPLPAPSSPIPPVSGELVNSPYSPPAYGGVAMPVSPPTSGLAIASLICGIMGLVTCLFLPGIPAVICGHMALSQMAVPGATIGGRGMAISGMVMGYISVVLGLGGIILFAIGIFANGLH